MTKAEAMRQMEADFDLAQDENLDEALCITPDCPNDHRPDSYYCAWCWQSRFEPIAASGARIGLDGWYLLVRQWLRVGLEAVVAHLKRIYPT